MKEFISLLFNGLSMIQLIVFMIYGFGGLLLNVIFDICKRDPMSPNSPIKMNIRYWWKDNWRRLIVSIVLLPLAIILFNQIMGSEINQMNAFFAGFSADAIAEIIKRRSFIGTIK